MRVAAIRPFLTGVRAAMLRFMRHPNSEHEQAVVRMVIAILICAYVVWFTPTSDNTASLLPTIGFFLCLSTLLLVDIALHPQAIAVRRVIGILNDTAGVSFGLVYADELGVSIYLFYLWITFGNGFRFGKAYLFVSLAGSLLGFSIVLMTVDYWQQHQQLGLSLWGGIILIGLYFSTLVTRLTKALQQEEAANQAKRSFISSVSHELRTPLNAIIGMANLLQSTALNREQNEMLRSLDNASHLMLTLVEDVLDFSKIEAGKLLIEEIAFDLHDLINSTVDIFKYQADARGLALLVRVDPAAPFALRGDPHHLRQVLVNLLSNAVKFTEQGRIVLRIECISDSDQRALLRFEVEDTGIGIALAAQGKVFESFTQADASTSRRYGGTGLGNTIARELVDLMGGQLGLRSEVGVGSTFWFELGLNKQPALPWSAPPAVRRVLLAGFSAAEQHAVAALLDTLAIPHSTAVDSAGAQAVLAQEREIPVDAGCDLVLLGAATLRIGDALKLAELRGLVSALQASAGRDDFPVILCDSAVTNSHARGQLAEQAGLQAVLRLPLKSSLLQNVLHAIAPRDGGSVRPEVPLLSALPSAVASSPQAARYQLLVAEDNPTNRIVIRKMLERAGHACTLVENGEQALDQLQQQDFDAVILDMNMPEMNGLEATRAIRFTGSRARHLPVIMLSADVTAETIAECMAAGVDQFLPKPIQIATLLDTLDRLTSQFGRQPLQLQLLPPAPLPKVAAIRPILSQPIEDAAVLNYATLAELDAIGQDGRFVDGVLNGFIEDGHNLMLQIEHSFQAEHFGDIKDLLHALKGASMSIGAISLRTTCALLESRSEAELRNQPAASLVLLQQAFQQLLTALDHYRRLRAQSAAHRR
jgi:two-component system sensor histidine kinase RpfC